MVYEQCCAYLVQLEGLLLMSSSVCRNWSSAGHLYSKRVHHGKGHPKEAMTSVGSASVTVGHAHGLFESIHGCR